jgi:hypothetical protein
MFIHMDNTTETEGYHKFRTEWYHKGSNHKMKDIQGCQQRGWNEDRRPFSLVFWLTQKVTPQLGLLIDPKSDSSVSKVVQQLPCWIEALQESKVNPQPTLEEGWCPSLWIDIHLLEMKIESNHRVKRWPSAKSKDDPVPSQNQGVSG